MRTPHTVWTYAITGLIAIIFVMATGCGGTQSDPDNATVPADTFNPEQRLADMDITLRTPGPPVANYVHAVRSGNMVYLAGHGPRKADGGWLTGKVGYDIDIEAGYAAARLTGINLLSSLKAEIGDLSRVRRVVKVLGMVNSDESFTEQPSVMNGFSDLMVAVFGERGRHARSAVGMAALPFNIPVEIEMIVEIDAE
jgi:enamine deaminase RidA (YjgF/YER057c/UK114 family)